MTDLPRDNLGRFVSPTAECIYIDGNTLVRLVSISREIGRSVSDLASTAVENEAEHYFRYRSDDPIKASQ